MFFFAGVLSYAKTENIPLINYKCDSGRSFKIRKINDDTVELRTRYSISRLKKDENASSEIYSNRNYELGLQANAAYLNIFGYFPSWSDDFYTNTRSNWHDSIYINELYRGCKISE